MTLNDLKALFTKFDNEYFDGVLHSILNGIKWTNAKSKLGSMHYYPTHPHEGGTIYINRRISDEEMINTLIHEMIHLRGLYDFINDGDRAKFRSNSVHGAEFEKWMNILNEKGFSIVRTTVASEIDLRTESTLVVAEYKHRETDVVSIYNCDSRTAERAKYTLQAVVASLNGVDVKTRTIKTKSGYAFNFKSMTKSGDWKKGMKLSRYYPSVLEPLLVSA